MFALDYEYSPRHPKARIPLIDPKLFAVYLESCEEDCWLSIFGPRLHDCYQLSPNRSTLTCIPKKKTVFDIQSKQGINDVAWGMEADYALSFWMVSFYHLLFLSPTFAYWVYYQTSHPGDWQNASVLTLTFLTALTLFWGVFIVVRGSQLRGGHR